YLLGMGALGRKFCLILDIDKVLSTDELLAVTESVADEASVHAPAVDPGADAPAKQKAAHFEAGA
ncbi:MAG: hypothetical protein ABSH02_02225, partial [Candidatus Sulfotelmatobacter sp.]